MRAPISYYGGKQYMYKKIIALFPPHQTYVEPFGGAASVLLNKEPSPVEVYNDIDGDVVNLFRVLRDRGDELTKKLKLTPYAREEFVACLDNHCEDSMEKARRTFVKFRQAFNGKGKTQGCWQYNIGKSRRGMAGTTSHWLSMIDLVLPEIVGRLRCVQIENLDAFNIITRYDTPNTLFYCDPPYVHESRMAANDYFHEMTEEQHHQLLELLNNIKGMTVLSGYRGELYNSLLTDWRFHEFNMSCHANKASTRNGKGGKKPRRTEVVWLNPAAVDRLELSESKQPELMR